MHQQHEPEEDQVPTPMHSNQALFRRTTNSPIEPTSPNKTIPFSISHHLQWGTNKS